MWGKSTFYSSVGKYINKPKNIEVKKPDKQNSDSNEI